ncbi:MAG: hypothetical protein DRN27_10040 [Thermoplasmata archaeon]|nr:MAG: hypothetical protein DRN27_10040 [Thermoplasmata archaeon]
MKLQAPKLPLKYRADFMLRYKEILDQKLSFEGAENGIFYFKGLIQISGKMLEAEMNVACTDMSDLYLNPIESIKNLLDFEYIDLFIDDVYCLRIQ